MKFSHAVLIVSLFIGFCTAHGSAYSPDENKSGMAGLQAPFIMNQGQVDQSVAFYARTLSGMVYVTHANDIVYALPAFIKDEHLRSVAVYERFEKGDLQTVKGEMESQTRISCFTGASHRKWNSDIPSYEQVNLGEVYDKITVKLKACGSNVEKLFFVNPGARPESIRIRASGVEGLAVNAAGELVMQTACGDVRFTRPTAFQVRDEEKVFIEAAYKADGCCYGFEVGPYDPDLPLVIDPLLASTFLGGTGNDYGSSMVVAPDGDLYISGDCSRASFPTTPGVYDTSFNNLRDAFISRFDPELTTLKASTFIGGNRNDYGNSLVIDTQGNVYLAGDTNSTNFPTNPACHDPTHNGNTDVYVAKFDGSLSSLLAVTFLGGTLTDARPTLALTSEGKVVVSGHTAATDFPTTPGAYCETYNGGGLLYGEGGDLFVSILNSDLTVLEASTYVGGGNTDISRSLALNAAGEIYLVGLTASNDFPTTPGAYDAQFHGGGMHGGDAFIAKLDGTLSSLSASTYLGSTGDDWAIHLMIDGAGDVYVTGDAFAADFPTTPGAFDRTFHGGMYGDTYISKLDGGLTTLKASTFLGGSGGEWGESILLHPNGSLYLSGMTQSPDFPATPGAFDATYNGGDRDVYIARLTPELDTLHACTFLGGNGFEWGSIALGAQGDLFAMGATGSADFPITANVYDASYNGGTNIWGGDVFASKIDENLSGSLTADAYRFKESAGATIRFTLNATKTHAGREYLLLGTMSGTDPGFSLPGGLMVLPLNWDELTQVILDGLGTPFFTSFYGFLDSEGTAEAVLTVPVLSGFSGTVLHFAFTMNNPFDFASNAVPITIEP
ncbi:MAG: SBBP repeat-containing protein [Planctomycetes bacterium]|nr:SBBP repeat-containing protein [Planctomycetota bacterium]